MNGGRDGYWGCELCFGHASGPDEWPHSNYCPCGGLIVWQATSYYDEEIEDLDKQLGEEYRP